jgi:muramoyltetrapeptide carboxypeptidase
MLLPPRLQAGDLIGVVTPSNPLTAEFQSQYDAGIACLHKMGFRTLAGDFVASTSWGYCADPHEKAADINRMFANPQVKAIMCSQGGITANGCLPHLNWEIIRANPKVFIGISDITTLLNAIWQQTGLITFHGNDVMWGFGNNPQPYDLSEFLAVLAEGRAGAVPANGERRTVRSGAAQGRLIGGNIHCLLKLAGTPYFPDCEDAILFLEAFRPSADNLDMCFQQLLQMGIFEQIRGMIIGFIDGLQNNAEATIQMEDILLRITPQFNFPILKMDDFGHNCPNTTLPVGIRVQMDADDQTLEFLETAVL